MASPVAIAVGAGVAVAVGGYLWYRKKQAAQPAGSTTCQGIGALAGELAAMAGAPADGAIATRVSELACRGTGVLGSISKGISSIIGTDGPSWGEKIAINEQLNGAAERVAPDFPDASYALTVQNKGLGLMGGIKASHRHQYAVIRHANGCVPYAASPGFSKCAPGTQSLRTHGTWSKVGEAQPAPGSGDPFSFKAGDGSHWINGKHVVCNEGSSLAIDRRTSPPSAVCARSFDAPTAPREPSGGDWWSFGMPTTDIDTIPSRDGTTRDHRSPL